MTPQQVRALIIRHYRKHGRHTLPWRTTHNPYRILVSELMLQQTQVERVIPFYRNFLKQFPTAKHLASAPLKEVLGAWQGLGYNRRAKMLHAAAKHIESEGLPTTVEGLEALPGVGPYTARAIAAFAYDEDVLLVETNVRTVVLHHFFADSTDISDAKILEVLEKVSPRKKGREWNWALMDYGSYLKRSGVALNAKSRHYAKQSKFSGSVREARGAVLRELHAGKTTKRKLVQLLGSDRAPQMADAIEALAKEGFIHTSGRFYELQT